MRRLGHFSPDLKSCISFSIAIRRRACSASSNAIPKHSVAGAIVLVISFETNSNYRVATVEVAFVVPDNAEADSRSVGTADGSSVHSGTSLVREDYV